MEGPLVDMKAIRKKMENVLNALSRDFSGVRGGKADAGKHTGGGAVEEIYLMPVYNDVCIYNHLLTYLQPCSIISMSWPMASPHPCLTLHK